MSDKQLYVAVARATGESIRQLKQLGFSLVEVPRVASPRGASHTRVRRRGRCSAHQRHS